MAERHFPDQECLDGTSGTSGAFLASRSITALARGTLQARSLARDATEWMTPMSFRRDAGDADHPTSSTSRAPTGPATSISFLGQEPGGCEADLRERHAEARFFIGDDEIAVQCASSQPPAMASPWTTATAGSWVVLERVERQPQSGFRRLSIGRSRRSFRSMPAQKAGPSARRTKHALVGRGRLHQRLFHLRQHGDGEGVAFMAARHGDGADGA